MGGNVVTMMPAMLPCPFCGSTETEVDVDSGVSCLTCSSTGPGPDHYSETETEAQEMADLIRVWNKRAETPIEVGGEVGERWAALLADAGRVKPWKDGDARCHCSHCPGCGDIFPTSAIGMHQPACVKLAREMFELRHAIVRLMQDKRHHGSCAQFIPPFKDPTFVYLKDGTKVVVKRKGMASWLEVLPQAVLKPSEGDS